MTRERSEFANSDLNEGFRVDIDRLLSPLFEIVKHYQANEAERRILFFTWVASIFKPVSAVEVARTLGYTRRQISEVYSRLESSSFLVAVDGGATFRVVGPDSSPLYVRRDLIAGRQVTGRIPKFLVFNNRQEVDLDALISGFNRDGVRMWKYVMGQVGELAASLDPDYISALVNDYSFLKEKISKLLNDLWKNGDLDIRRTGDSYSVHVALKKASFQCEVPRIKELKDIV